MKDNLYSRYGGWAVVAGASEGLGAEYARQLARLGFDLLLIARREDELMKRKTELESNVTVEIFVADLSLENELNNLILKLNQMDVGLFVYNAVFPLIGHFIDKDIEDHKKLIRVNCYAPMLLTYRIANQMVKRGRGGILLMSSMAGMQGSAVVAHYAASKAYNQVLAEGLWYELKNKGIDIMAVVAGATSTPNYLKSNPQGRTFGTPAVMDAKDVVRDAIKFLGKRPSIITGRMNRLAAYFMKRIFSRRKAINIISRETTNMYPHYLNK